MSRISRLKTRRAREMHRMPRMMARKRHPRPTTRLSPSSTPFRVKLWSDRRAIQIEWIEDSRGSKIRRRSVWQAFTTETGEDGVVEEVTITVTTGTTTTMVTGTSVETTTTTDSTTTRRVKEANEDPSGTTTARGLNVSVRESIEALEYEKERKREL